MGCISKLCERKAARNYNGTSLMHTGFIGKLFHTEQLPKLANLARVFYNDTPVDLLLAPWRELMGQPEPVAYIGSSLFQHRGVVSSLPGRVQLLRERVFFENDSLSPSSSMRYGGDNPPASLNTDVTGYDSSPLLQSVYTPLLGARAPFWFKTPRQNNWILIRFLQPIRLEKVIIDSGELKHKENRNVLLNALTGDIAIVKTAEPGLLGNEQLQANESEYKRVFFYSLVSVKLLTCLLYFVTRKYVYTDVKVCTFNATGFCYADELHKVYGFRVSQLRIQFETNYTHDAVINEIGVFTYKKSNSSIDLRGGGKLLEDPVEVMLGKRKAYEKMLNDAMAKNMDLLSGVEA